MYGDTGATPYTFPVRAKFTNNFVNFLTILSSLSSRTTFYQSESSEPADTIHTKLQDAGVEEVEEIITMRDARL